MSDAPNKPKWLVQLEMFVNKTLQMDEETLFLLAQLKGKTIAFDFINMKLTLYLFPVEKGLLMEKMCTDKPDVLIKSTLINFIMMLVSSKQKTGNLSSDMQVIGDIGLAQQFQKIMQSIEIDFEELLSQWVGDLTAYQISKFIKGAGSFVFDTGKILITDISEYLRFENKMLPDDLLVEEFCKEVDILRESVDRLSEHINRLESKIVR